MSILLSVNHLDQPTFLKFLAFFSVLLAVASGLRAGYINALAGGWNDQLSQYVNHIVYAECLSQEEEEELNRHFFYPDYRDYFNFKKWQLEDFITCGKLLEEVEQHFESVNSI